MKSYVWLTFGFMGWAYYEMSGGAEFEAQERLVAEAEIVEPAVQAPQEDIVARAETTTLMSISTSNVTPQPDAEAVVVQAVAEVVAPIEDPVVEIVAPVVEPVIDLRNVAGSRVNMRMGPSTDYDVITTLDGGTEIEVLQVNADGWANVMVVNSGIEGWMAERLLSDPQT